MAFKEMKFKGQRVFVEIDGNGDVIAEQGRARMRYKPEDERVYRPNLKNLEDSDGAGRHRPSRTPVRELRQTPSKKNGEPVVAYTDGACSGNPGPSGLGYVVVFPDGRREQRGEPLGQGTNNIAELTAIERVLELIGKTDNPLVIFTDSEYAIGVLSRGWKAKANSELIARIKRAMARFPGLRLEKVAGHAGVPENELVDKLARKAAETQNTVKE